MSNNKQSMENKQSSLELFAIALYEGGFLQGNGDEINDLLEEHKAIHKEEIENAFINGYLTPFNEQNNINAEEIYYNETYGGNNK
tara:strand:+ start:225 stop:479 length:255 start_codon:yes stop_codon:yes gene_type:complete